jgi:hypothetical protein
MADMRSKEGLCLQKDGEEQHVLQIARNPWTVDSSRTYSASLHCWKMTSQNSLRPEFDLENSSGSLTHPMRWASLERIEKEENESIAASSKSDPVQYQVRPTAQYPARFARYNSNKDNPETRDVRGSRGASHVQNTPFTYLFLLTSRSQSCRSPRRGPMTQVQKPREVMYSTSTARKFNRGDKKKKLPKRSHVAPAKIESIEEQRGTALAES